MLFFTKKQLVGGLGIGIGIGIIGKGLFYYFWAPAKVEKSTIVPKVTGSARDVEVQTDSIELPVMVEASTSLPGQAGEPEYKDDSIQTEVLEYSVVF